MKSKARCGTIKNKNVKRKKKKGSTKAGRILDACLREYTSHSYENPGVWASLSVLHWVLRIKMQTILLRVVKSHIHRMWSNLDSSLWCSIYFRSNYLSESTLIVFYWERMKQAHFPQQDISYLVLVYSSKLISHPSQCVHYPPWQGKTGNSKTWPCPPASACMVLWPPHHLCSLRLIKIHCVWIFHVICQVIKYTPLILSGYSDGTKWSELLTWFKVPSFLDFQC